MLIKLLGGSGKQRGGSSVRRCRPILEELEGRVLLAQSIVWEGGVNQAQEWSEKDNCARGNYGGHDTAEWTSERRHTNLSAHQQKSQHVC